ncbi:MAG TPA: hypothetical protein VGR95_11155 [Thermoanaerobaculia bacterium]|nr:hypothetical protein [Thermoanaerobaculia bacterium]
MIAIATGAAWRRDAYGVQGAWTATSTVGMYGSIEHIRAVPAYLQGRREALIDLRKGCLRLNTWGLPAPSSYIYMDLAAKRLGIDTRVTAGCVVDPIREAAWIGYNGVMEREIDRRYGKDALDNLMREANSIYRQRYQRGELPWQIRANHGRVIPPKT